MHGAHIPILVAEQKKKQREQLEEEKMTGYSPDEMNDDWEFKIVRGGHLAFRNPDTFAQLVEEEGEAGWTLLEKLDDSRVRFKRPKSAHRNDAYLPDHIDPYRTQFGRPTDANTAIVLVISGILLSLGLGAAMFFVKGQSPYIIISLVAGLIVVIGMVAVMTSRGRR